MWQQETLYFEPRHFIEQLCQDIATAQNSVRVEVYIFSKDGTGEKLLAAMQQAADNGAQVSLLIDGIGSSSWSRSELLQLHERGISARVHNPPPRPLGWFYDYWLPQIHRLPLSLTRLNKRTHRKAVTIDSERAWVGSQNYGDSFLGWRENNCQVRGPAVRALEYSLLRAWCSAAAPSPSIDIKKQQKRAAMSASRDVLTNATLLSRYRHRTELLNHIRHAHQRVQMTTAYFVPTTGLIVALLKAAKNGAKVELIVPRKSNYTPLRWLGQLYYQVLLQGGIEVYEYLPTMLHAKSAIIDDWAIIGSTNLNHRSFYHDLEVDIVLRHKSSLLALKQQFHTDRELSERITHQWLQKRPWVTKLAARLAHTVRSWL